MSYFANDSEDRYFTKASGNTNTTNIATNVTNIAARLPLAGGTLTGDLTIPDKIIHSGDTNTFIRFPAADTFSVDTAGSEALRIDSSGNVGIGTTSPDTNLQVTATGSASNLSVNSNISTSALASRILLGNSVGYARATFGLLGGGGETAYLGTEGNFPLYFQTNGTERMRIDSSGNMLLGGTLPSAPNISLNANGSASFKGDITKTRSDSTASSVIIRDDYLRIYDNPVSYDDYKISLEKDGSATFAGGNCEITNDGFTRIKRSVGTSGLALFPNNDFTQAATISLNTDGSATFAGNVFLGDSSSTFNIFANTNNAAAMHLSGGGSGSANIDLHGSNHGSDPKTITFDTNSSERMRINASGRLGIGTSSPGSLLQVNSAAGTISGIALGTTTQSITASRYIGICNNADHTSIGTNSGFSGIEFGGPSSANEGYLAFHTHDVGVASGERMRIDKSGGTRIYSSTPYTLNVRTDAAAGGADYVLWASSAVTDILTGGSTVFAVYTNGNVQNTNNSYGALSDIKLKENIVDASSQWDDIKALRPVNYNFKEGQTHTQLGLIAQEVELVSPGLVTESPDRDEDGNDLGTVTKSVNYSVLYMKAVKALQEAMERIETLEQRLTDAGL
jgi:hypothetical protein